jgi:GDP-mannose 6-dehydrogenase
VHLERALRLVEQHGRKRIGLLGLSFKSSTDDLRESPSVVFAERLIGRGYQLSIFDEDVNPTALRGANRAFVEEHLPHVQKLLTATLETTVEAGEVLVVVKSMPALERLSGLLRPDHVVVDLVGIPWSSALSGDRYEGIGW